MSWVFIESEPELWTVGFYKPDGTWVGEGDYHVKAEAMLQVHFLNGGGVTQ